jgi:AcrR family transcriptional regulator
MTSTSGNPTTKKSRGDVTKDQLLAAGLEAFAKYGPDGVSTRQLADAAGVNVAAIGYHFGGKEGYYLAVVEYFIKEHAKPILSLISQISERLQSSDHSPEVARNLLVRLLRTLSENILLNPNGRFITGIASREHIHPTSAFELIYEQLTVPLHGMISELIGCVTNTPATSMENIARAHVLVGQTLYFALGGITLRRRMGWDEISEKRAEFLAEIVSEMTERAIGAPEPVKPAEE